MGVVEVVGEGQALPCGLFLRCTVTRTARQGGPGGVSEARSLWSRRGLAAPPAVASQPAHTTLQPVCDTHLAAPPFASFLFLRPDHERVANGRHRHDMGLTQ